MNKLDPSFYDSKTTLVNLSNSILKHYGAPTYHASIPEVDEILANHPKVALFLFDGAGEENLKIYPRQSKFMREHKLMTIHSVNPATTVACTTALLTAHYPIEDGWLGWSLYFKELGYPVDVFPNKNSLTDKELPVPDVMGKKSPIVNLETLLERVGVPAKCVFQTPLGDGKGPSKIKEIVPKVEEQFAAGKQFVYCYWTEPDHQLHHYGTHSFRIRHKIRQINAVVKRFVKRNPDVLVLTIADHGLIDVQYRDIAAFPEIADCLALPMSIEGRTPTFFLKEGTAETFKAAFAKRFPNFYLMSRQEALDSHYFGEGTPSPIALDFIGDFVAVSLGNEVLCNSRDKKDITVHLGHHAGGTPAERNILLAAYNR